MSQRQLHPKGRAAADAALDVHLAAVGLGHVLDDGEAEAGAPLVAGPALVDAVEALEETGDRLGGDADPCVAHLDDRLVRLAHLAVRAGEAEGDLAVRTVVLD